MYIITVFLSLWARILLPFLFADDTSVKENSLVAPAEKALLEHIDWSPDRKLSWEDFKAMPDEENSHHALTAANLAVNARCEKKGFSYQVSCVFLPTQSWTKNTRSEKLLKHEQMHFDLTEVHAQLLRKKLEQLKCADAKEKLSGTVTAAFARWKSEQDAFDKACKHGLNAEAEAIWAADIATRLVQLAAYK